MLTFRPTAAWLVLTLAATLPVQAATDAPKPAAAASQALQLVHAGQPWLPGYGPDDWNMAHASAASQAICKRSEAMPIPSSDLPRAADLPSLASCQSASLYYGYTGKADPVRARQCAYLERADGNEDVIGGSAVLSMIYANGMGVPRNLPLATKFACEAGGAPAEIDGRIEHLGKLATTTAKPQHSFDFCDDITSGLMEGFCANIQLKQADGQRDDAIGQITRDYSATQLQAFTALRNAADAYFKAHSNNEVDLSGTARGAFAVADQDSNEKVFLDNLKAMEAGKLPTVSAVDAKQADTKLNTIYRRVLANPDLQPQTNGTTGEGTISARNVRTDQRLWLTYRDAWLRFVAARKPELSRNTVLAWLTSQRTDDLRSLLPSNDPDYRNDSDH